LNALITKVSTAKKLTDGQKTSLTNDMQGQVTSMTTLKTKLDADTVVTTAATDFQSTFSAHYIYAYYIPRTERIIAADAEANAATNLSDLAAKFTDYIATASAANNDTAALTAKLTEMKTKIADAQTQAATVSTSLLALTVSGHPANKTIITASAANLKTGRADLESAGADAKSLTASLKKLLAS
jgi:hypothetical protein